MNYKRCICLTAILIVIDQSVKLFVFGLYMNKIFTIIPNVLFFNPVQNKHLSYFGSLLEIETPLIAMILMEVIGGAMLIMCCRYCLYLSERHRKLLTCSLSFGLAGISGAFIDNIFWGGSIDFIKLFDWFTFDLKDVYLCAMSALIILYVILYMPEYYKLSEEERKKRGLIIWIKKGCPITFTL